MFIVSFKSSLASSPAEIILESSTFTFSNDISAHDCPSTVENELIDSPEVFESKIIIFNSLSLIQVVIILSAFAPFKTSVLVPFNKLLSKVELGSI